MRKSQVALTLMIYLCGLSSLVAEVVVQTKRITVESGVAKFIVVAENKGASTEKLVTAKCTVFDRNGEPLGTGSEIFSSIGAGEKVYDTALVELSEKGTPVSASCRVDQ